MALLGRRAWLCLAALLAFGCADILGIDEPMSRVPAGAGESGLSDSVHGSSGREGFSAGSATNEAGALGEHADNGGAESGGASGREPSEAGGGGSEAGTAGANGGDGAGGSGASAGVGGSSAGLGGGGSGGGGSSGGGAAGLGGGTAGSGGAAPECTTPSPKRCKGNAVVQCESGKLKTVEACDNFCANAACVFPPSCPNSLKSCQGESCCRSLEVTGGKFYRDGQTTYQATISSFTMDRYEVTVSRLGAYLNDYLYGRGSAPAVGSGKVLHNATDPGWKAIYSSFLPSRASSAEVLSMLGCVWPPPSSGGGGAGTGSGGAGGNGGSGGSTVVGTYFSGDKTNPANCMTFYVAQAFCIWDGGRLPTEAEWNYAATGGDKQLYFPWSESSYDKQIDPSRAVYDNAPIQPVGTKNGEGRFGQRDMAGNLSEWTLDYFLIQYPTTCSDCLTTTVAPTRPARGGSFISTNPLYLSTGYRTDIDPDGSRKFMGFRCVHDLTSQ